VAKDVLDHREVAKDVYELRSGGLWSVPQLGQDVTQRRPSGRPGDRKVSQRGDEVVVGGVEQNLEPAGGGGNIAGVLGVGGAENGQPRVGGRLARRVDAEDGADPLVLGRVRVEQGGDLVDEAGDVAVPSE
jgi:hypothetical protein